MLACHSFMNSGRRPEIPGSETGVHTPGQHELHSTVVPLPPGLTAGNTAWLQGAAPAVGGQQC